MPKKKKSKPKSLRPQSEKPYHGPDLEPCLYRNKLTDNGAKTFERALRIKDIDQELALLRTRVETILADDNKNTPLLLKAVELVIRAYSARARVSDDPSAPTEQAIDSMLKDASEKYGLSIIPWDSNC